MGLFPWIFFGNSFGINCIFFSEPIIFLTLTIAGRHTKIIDSQARHIHKQFDEASVSNTTLANKISKLVKVDSNILHNIENPLEKTEYTTNCRNVDVIIVSA